MAVVAFDDHGGCHIAKDKMRVPISEIQMPCTNFWVDHEHSACTSGDDHIVSLLDAKGGGGAGDIHVKREALDTKCLLHLDSHRWVGTLHIRSSHDNSVDLIGCDISHLNGAFSCCAPDFAHD